jgi:hypothetical protein
MTVPDPAGSAVPASARAAAIFTWVPAAAFGLPAIPVAVFIARERSLPVAEVKSWVTGVVV